MPPPPPPPTPPYTSPPYIEGEDWWERPIQTNVISLIDYKFDSQNINPLSDAVAFLSDRRVNDIILEAHAQLTTQLSEQSAAHGHTPRHLDPESEEFKHDKRRILSILVSMRQRRRTDSGTGAAAPSTAPRLGNERTGHWTPVPVTGLLNTLANAAADAKPVQSTFAAPSPMTGVVTPAATPLDSALTPRPPKAAESHFSPIAESAASPRTTSVTTSPNPRRRRSSSSTHPDIKPTKRQRGPQVHTCLECHKDFPFRSKLNDHMRIHEDNKPFKCEFCSKSFKRGREVTAHVKAVHKIMVQGNMGSPASPSLTLRPPPPTNSTPKELPAESPQAVETPRVAETSRSVEITQVQVIEKTAESVNHAVDKIKHEPEEERPCILSAPSKPSGVSPPQNDETDRDRTESAASSRQSSPNLTPTDSPREKTAPAGKQDVAEPKDVTMADAAASKAIRTASPESAGSARSVRSKRSGTGSARKGKGREMKHGSKTPSDTSSEGPQFPPDDPQLGDYPFAGLFPPERPPGNLGQK